MTTAIETHAVHPRVGESGAGGDDCWIVGTPHTGGGYWRRSQPIEDGRSRPNVHAEPARAKDSHFGAFPWCSQGDQAAHVIGTAEVSHVPCCHQSTSAMAHNIDFGCPRGGHEVTDELPHCFGVFGD